MQDSVWMSAALDQARLASGLSAPNPAVGCLLVSITGHELGRGHTQKRGGPHAEVVAMRAAIECGLDLSGCTAYVTLEPCSHHGRTPPCCDALIGAGVQKIVASLADPNPLVSGRGFERLRAAGIEVEVGPGATESRELNIGFFSRMIRKTPWVRMKVAASLDGKTALMNGQSQWITREAARADGHSWRARSSAVLTGIGTVLEDQPRLDVRLVACQRQPDVVVIDSRLETPLDAALLLVPDRTCYIYAAVPDEGKQAALEAKGATVIYKPGSKGKVDLAAMLQDLAAREVNELHVEAGHKLNGSLLREGLVDELLIYLAPKLMGTAQGMASFGPLETLAEAVDLDFMSADMIGSDMRIRARIAGRDQF